MHGQRARAWIDASASTTQPPAGVVADAAAYGLLGVRAELDASPTLTVGARGQAGAGARRTDGRWVYGEATAAWVQRVGPITLPVDASGLLLRYTDPYEYDARVLRLQPGLRASLRRVQLTLQADFARGDWSSRYPDTTQTDGFLENDGVMRIDGAELSAASWLGAVDVELGVGVRDATNGTRDGRYTTLHTTASMPVGPATAFGTVRLQEARSGTEAGGELGVMLELGSRTTLIALLSEPVTDPLYGTRSGFGASIGASVRLHATPGRAGIAVIGPPAAGRRSVTLRVRALTTPAVSAAGSFNGWTPVAMRRDGEEWTLTLHLEPGSYTFAFQKADGSWFVPDDAPGIVDDGFGQRNATLVVPPL